MNKSTPTPAAAPAATSSAAAAGAPKTPLEAQPKATLKRVRGEESVADSVADFDALIRKKKS